MFLETFWQPIQSWLIAIPGPDFLLGYTPYLLGGLLMLRLSANWRLEAAAPPSALPPLTPLELACLRDGRQGMLETILLELWQKGLRFALPEFCQQRSSRSGRPRMPAGERHVAA